MRITRRFGDIVRSRLGPKTFHVINHPTTRYCIGAHFGLVEGQLAIAMITQRYHLALVQSVRLSWNLCAPCVLAKVVLRFFTKSPSLDQIDAAQEGRFLSRLLHYGPYERLHTAWAREKCGAATLNR